MTAQPSRRDVLRLAGLTGLAAVATACTGGSGTRTTTSTAPTSTPATTPTTSTPPTGSATTTVPAKPTYADLRKQLSNRLATPGQSTYKPLALLYNPRFSRQPKPRAIAYCASAADVAACVRFAADGGGALRIRNGGHSYGGWSSGSGLVANLAAMNRVRVDRNAGTATVGAGALLEDVYAQLAAQGVSIGSGSCATVGITGITLGGGVGLLTRQYGLTCDQVVSFAVVTADGRSITASADEHPDLFFALRGGGGSFAAVTSLTFRVRPAPQVQQVYLEWPGSDAAQVLSAWQQWMPNTPRALWSTFKILARPGEGVRTTLTAVWTGAGSPDAQIARLLRNTPPPGTNSPSSNSYGAAMLASAGCEGSAQDCITAALTPAQRLPEAAASSILRTSLPDKAIQAIADAVQTGMDVNGMVEGGVSFDALGGAVADHDADATAFPWRTAIADIQYTATWPFANASNAGAYDRFVQHERATLRPYLGDSAYLNYADPTLSDYATAYWGDNLARLKDVKKTYDPHDVFSSPQGVHV